MGTKQFVAIIALVVVSAIGYLTFILIGKTDSGPVFEIPNNEEQEPVGTVVEPQPSGHASFTTPTIIPLGGRMIFEDGLQVTLTAIQDSRCPVDVTCIWEGELSPQFVITGGSIRFDTHEVTMGTRTRESVGVPGYTLFLVNAQTDRVTLTVVPTSPE